MVMNHHLYDKRSHVAVLLHRVFLGVLFLIYAWPVLLGGPESWVQHSSASLFEHTGTRSFYGFLELCIFVFGGVFLISGLYTIPVSMLLTVISILNVTFEWSAGSPFFPNVAMFSLFALSCVVVAVQGAGRHSLDYRFYLRRVRRHRVR